MKNILRINPNGLVWFLWILFGAEPVLATQGHGAPEGLYAHQFAHIVFTISMGILIFWLRERNLVRQTGWRYIQYAALFFILWNVDAFTVHLLEGMEDVLNIVKIGPWQVRIQTEGPFGWLKFVYYVAKLDHLFCVPALLFLYTGLRRLSRETDPVRLRGAGS